MRIGHRGKAIKQFILFTFLIISSSIVFYIEKKKAIKQLCVSKSSVAGFNFKLLLVATSSYVTVATSSKEREREVIKVVLDPCVAIHTHAVPVMTNLPGGVDTRNEENRGLNRMHDWDLGIQHV